MEVIKKYFPELTEEQLDRFSKLGDLYRFWNSQINVISRKDIDFLYLHHVLHSLTLAKVMKFTPKTKILDVGCGGGFPGIPLAILFPEVNFFMVDSIGKKIKVVNEVAKALGLKNVKAEHMRVQDVKDKFDFVVSRAVTSFPSFVDMVRKNISLKDKNALPNGILYLKGGDFDHEIKAYGKRISIYECTEFFEEDFFETKKVIHLSV